MPTKIWSKHTNIGDSSQVLPVQAKLMCCSEPLSLFDAYSGVMSMEFPGSLNRWDR